MTPSPHTLAPGASLGEALAIMGKRGILSVIDLLEAAVPLFEAQG